MRTAETVGHAGRGVVAHAAAAARMIPESPVFKRAHHTGMIGGEPLAEAALTSAQGNHRSIIRMA